MAAANATETSCPPPTKATSDGVFQHNNPLDFALPLVVVQICLIIVVTRVLAFLLRPLRQPRIIAEIVGGILLGPSVLGRGTGYLHRIFPARSLTVLDTLANLGLLFFLFLVGLEFDPQSLRRTGRKAMSIALAAITVPFMAGIGTSFLLRATITGGATVAPFLVFMGVAFSITAFPVLARILAELKLLTTDMGQMAMSAAAVNDVAAWILLALAVALSGTKNSPLVSLWVVLSGAGLVALSIFLVPRVFKWMAQRCPEGEPMDELYVCATLVAVLATAFLTDMIGIHALFGSLIIGVLVPKEGPFAGSLVEKVEDLVSAIFLPLFFVSSGLKTDVGTIRGAQSWSLLLVIICTASSGKIFGTFAASRLCQVPFRESLALGFLMNTKGLVEIVVLNIGKDRMVLNDEIFALMVLMTVFTTFITTPLVVAVYKPKKFHSKATYKHRTVEREDPGSQLRIMACFHSIKNIPTMINLIEYSRGTTDQNRGLCVYAMHLMELSERSSSILMVQRARKNGLPFWDKDREPSENQVVVAFEAFRQLSRVVIRTMTAISALSNIHEDICASAARKRAAIIILPYHKHQRLDGVLETTRAEFRWVNKRVLEHGPCTVGIIVDRGLGGSSHVSASNVSSTIAVLFFGGHDDREALAYGRRMAEHPGISLVVVRLVMSSEVAGDGSLLDEDDDIALEEIKHKSEEERGSVKYLERQADGPEDVVEVVKEHSHCNLFLVGRTPGGQPATSLNTKSDCAELGPVWGGLLTSPEFSTMASVLVVKKYRGMKGRSDPNTVSRRAEFLLPED